MSDDRNLAWSQVPPPPTAPYTQPEYAMFEPIPGDIEPARAPQPRPAVEQPKKMAGPKIKYPRFHVFRFLFLLFASTVVCVVMSVAAGGPVTTYDQILGRNIVTYQAATWPLLLWVFSVIGLIVWHVYRYVAAQKAYKAAIGERHNW